MSDSPDPWREEPKPRGRLPLLLLLAVGVAALIGFLIWRFPYALEGRGEWATLIYMLVFLALVSGGALHKGVRMRQMIRNAAIWVGIAGAVGIGYGYRFELTAVKDRLLGELVPGVGREGPGGEVRFRAGAGGHYRIEALVDGVAVRFLVDTGASDVVLSPRDAARLGLDPARLDYSRTYRTANGVVKGAPIILDRIQVGPIVVRDVPGSVNGAPLGASLLGMSFLERLSGYSVENGTLVLRQ